GLLSYKAAWADRRYVAVNPSYTSQDCSQCGHQQTLSLSDRIYTCPCCGIVLDRDYNASLNIVRLGQQSVASAEKPPAFTVGSCHLPLARNYVPYAACDFAWGETSKSASAPSDSSGNPQVARMNWRA